MYVFSCIFITRKRSLNQGNVFIPVSHSVHGGGAACPIACLDTNTPRTDTLPLGIPPSNTTAYGQQAGCTHPTGMHTCYLCQQNSSVSFVPHPQPICSRCNTSLGNRAPKVYNKRKRLIRHEVLSLS